MEFEFDPPKDEANRFKHGLRLAFGARIFATQGYIVVPTVRLGMKKNASRRPAAGTESSTLQSTSGAVKWFDSFR